MSLIVALLLGSACSGGDNSPDTIRLLTHEGFHVPEDAIAAFTEQTGVQVVVFREADSTAMADLLRRSQTNPVADVVLGIDTLDLHRVIEERLVEPYRPLTRDVLDAELLVDNDWLTPVSYLDACPNRSISFYQPPERSNDELPNPEDLPPPIPTGIGDFVDPEHSATLVIPDARTSRMGLYFLVALERLYPEDTGDPEAIAWPQFLGTLLAQGALITDSWEESYFTHFLPGADTTAVDNEFELPSNDEDIELQPTTERPITWGSSGMPAVSVRFQPDLPETIDIDVITNDCIRIVNYAGMVANTPSRLDAGRFIDMLIEPLFQFGVPDRFGSRPARGDIVRTDAWREFGVDAEAPMLDPTDVGTRWPVWQLTWNQVLSEFDDGTEPVEPFVPVTLP